MRKIIQKVNANHGIENRSFKELDDFVVPSKPSGEKIVSILDPVFSTGATEDMSLSGSFFGSEELKSLVRPRIRIKNPSKLHPGIVGDTSCEE